MSFFSLILFGAPGSGKGTQSEILAKQFNLFHLSTGDLLREVKNDTNSPLCIVVNEKMSKGELVSDDIIFDIISNKISSIKTNSSFRGVIFDGFPRNTSQAEFLDKKLIELGIENSLIFIFKISPEVVIDRISNRFTCSQCHTIYNKISKAPRNPNICDICKAKNSFSDRVDDTPDIIKSRLKVFDENMEKLRSFYGDQVFEVDASLEPEEVFNFLKKILENSKKIV